MNERSAAFETVAPPETALLGERLGGLLMAGDVVALEGELGSGKTCFTKGVAVGLGVSRQCVVTSPSFALVNEYAGRCPLYHMDAYRLEDREAFLSSGLEEYFYAGGVAVLEWADRWPELLPAHSVRVAFSHLARGRRLVFSGTHRRAWEIVAQMRVAR